MAQPFRAAECVAQPFRAAECVAQPLGLPILSVGRLADLVMLDRNIFEIEPEQIRATTTELTVVAGKIVHRKK